MAYHSDWFFHEFVFLLFGWLILLEVFLPPGDEIWTSHLLILNVFLISIVIRHTSWSTSISLGFVWTLNGGLFVNWTCIWIVFPLMDTQCLVVRYMLGVGLHPCALHILHVRRGVESDIPSAKLILDIDLTESMYSLVEWLILNHGYINFFKTIRMLLLLCQLWSSLHEFNLKYLMFIYQSYSIRSWTYCRICS